MPNALAGYIPRRPSALVGSGLNLNTEFGIDPGTRDFFGSPVPTSGMAGNIGAAEAQPAIVSAIILTTSHATAWFQVYPTVVRDEIRVVAEHSLPLSVNFRLFDMVGRECQSWTRHINQQQSNTLVLSIAGLAMGRYVLHIQSEGHSQHQSLIVTK